MQFLVTSCFCIPFSILSLAMVSSACLSLASVTVSTVACSLLLLTLVFGDVMTVETDERVEEAEEIERRSSSYAVSWLELIDG